MDNASDGVEMQVRKVRTDASNASLGDASAGAEVEDLQHHSAAVRRLLSDESFHAPKQEGTVRILIFANDFWGIYFMFSGVELKIVISLGSSRQCGWVG
jgi:hypothetical protein